MHNMKGLLRGVVIVLLPVVCTAPDCAEEPGKSVKAPTGSRDTSSFDMDYLLGLFDPATHPGFTPVDTTHADRPGLYLRNDVYAAFRKMHAAANNDGITLVIRSATRNFAYQKSIWERKWSGETKIENGRDASVAYPDPVDRARAILRFSAMPGSSRHHWGTEIDLNAFENSWFEKGEGLRLYTWLRNHAGEFGFCQPYTEKGGNRHTGYEEEKWHWTYLPVGRLLTNLAADSLRNDMLTGFAGSETADTLDVVGNYVLGIDPVCR